MLKHVFIIKKKLCQSFWQLVKAFRFEAKKIEGDPFEPLPSFLWSFYWVLGLTFRRKKEILSEHSTLAFSSPIATLSYQDAYANNHGSEKLHFTFALTSLCRSSGFCFPRHKLCERKTIKCFCMMLNKY